MGSLLQRTDRRRLSCATDSGTTSRSFPSDYVRQHAYFTYVTDGYGIDNRHRIGVDRIMWSSDYPHGNSNYPDAWSPVKASMSGVAEHERIAILAGNAMSLYHFGA